MSIIRTGQLILVKLIDLMNFVIIQTALLKLLIFLLGSMTVTLTVLLFCVLSLDPIIFSMLALPSSRTSFASVSNHFPSNLKGAATFLYLTYD